MGIVGWCVFVCKKTKRRMNKHMCKYMDVYIYIYTYLHRVVDFHLLYYVHIPGDWQGIILDYTRSAAPVPT